MSHTCDVCSGSRSRRALRALLEKTPNMTTERAARVLDANRPYLNTVRCQMERAGCVPKRTVDGRGQAVKDRAAVAEFISTQARAMRGFPIGSVWAWG